MERERERERAIKSPKPLQHILLNERAKDAGKGPQGFNSALAPRRPDAIVPCRELEQHPYGRLLSARRGVCVCVLLLVICCLFATPQTAEHVKDNAKMECN